MTKIPEYKILILNDSLRHCEYLNESIKEARNKLWIIASINISIIGFLLTKLNEHQIKIEEKPLFYISIPFLIFNVFYISRGMMPAKKEDLHPAPSKLVELEEEEYFISKVEFYKIVSENYQDILKNVINSYIKCTYSTILFLLLNILFFIIRVVAEVCPY